MDLAVLLPAGKTWWTLADLADTFDGVIGQETLRREINDGVLQAHRLRGRLVVSRTALLSYLERTRTTGPNDDADTRAGARPALPAVAS